VVLDGPDAYTGKEVVDAMNAKAGLIWQWGALDFAGGTVVHINAAWRAWWAPTWSASAWATAGGDGAAQPAADDGRCLAAVGGLVRLQRRLGAGSGQQRRAGLHEHLLGHRRGGAGLVPRRGADAGKASMLGAASGAVAGLVAITPAAATWASSARW
jgi:Amt family ammonium transporter